MALSRMKAARLRRRAQEREQLLDQVTRKLGGVLDEDATRPYKDLAKANRDFDHMLDAMVYGRLAGKPAVTT